jgi:polar amino acid transport system substrate-binding protein
VKGLARADRIAEKNREDFRMFYHASRRRVATAASRLVAFLLMALTVGVGLMASSTAQAREVRLVTLNWPPYYGAELPDQGFITDVVRQALDRQGHTLVVEFMPWARALREARNGAADGLLGAYYNDERAQDFYFSDNIYNDNVGLVTVEDGAPAAYESLRDLQDYTIGMGRGFSVSPEFDEADYLRRVVASDNVINIRKLYAGRVDYVAGSWTAMAAIVRDEGLAMDRLAFVDPPLQTNGLFITGVRSRDTSAEMIAAFNRGLEALRRDGTFDDLLEKHDLPVDGKPTPPLAAGS